jgi:hypothetical protein
MDQRCFVLPTAYFPNLEYMAILVANHTADQAVWLEAEEYYVKQTYRNRAYILGPHQIEMLTVPVIGGTKKVKIKELKIENGRQWQKQHWRGLQTGYGKSPFWEHYAPMLNKHFTKQYNFLWDLNCEVLSTCLELLGVAGGTTYKETSTYKKQTKPACLDLRGQFRPNIPTAERELYFPVPYLQVFGSTFVENLSVLDLLFCEGPHASSLLRQSFRLG